MAQNISWLSAFQSPEMHWNSFIYTQIPTDIGSNSENINLQQTEALVYGPLALRIQQMQVQRENEGYLRGRFIIDDCIVVDSPTQEIAQQALSFWQMKQQVMRIVFIVSAIIATAGFLVGVSGAGKAITAMILASSVPLLAGCWVAVFAIGTLASLILCVYSNNQSNHAEEELTFWSQQVQDIAQHGDLPTRIALARTEIFKTYAEGQTIENIKRVDTVLVSHNELAALVKSNIEEPREDALEDEIITPGARRIDVATPSLRRQRRNLRQDLTDMLQLLLERAAVRAEREEAV